MMDRRTFLSAAAVLTTVGVGGLLSRAQGASATGRRRPRTNILFLTSDDMGYESMGCTGCPLPRITPSLDQLAGEGVLFDHCYCATPICGPARAAWITGTWPQHSGHMGHYNQPPKWFGPSPVPTTVPEQLRSEGGYYTGVICKCPDPRGWDHMKDHTETGLGRDPSKYYRLAREFFETAAAQKQPFFLHANVMDPHEYWAGQEQETKAWIDAMMGSERYETYSNGKPYPEPQVTYPAEQVPVPACWPDNAEMREDLAPYYGSVRRMDEALGAVLRALRESGQEDDTMVVFVSDQGIGREFAKCSLYPNGTRTPMIVRWPGVTKPGRHDTETVFSSIDVAPTFLEVAGVEVPGFMDGRSLIEILRKPGRHAGRDKTFSCFNYMNNYPEMDGQFTEYVRDLADRHPNYRPMRAIHGTRYTYIWNGWANGTNEIPREMSSDQAIRRILRETGHERRADFEAFRTREELYDTVRDPGCLTNLIGDVGLAGVLSEYRAELLAILERTRDQETPNYQADLQAAATLVSGS